MDTRTGLVWFINGNPHVFLCSQYVMVVVAVNNEPLSVGQ